MVVAVLRFQFVRLAKAINFILQKQVPSCGFTVIQVRPFIGDYKIIERATSSYSQKVAIISPVRPFIGDYKIIERATSSHSQKVAIISPFESNVVI